jgi:hypothetical protein
MMTTDPKLIPALFHGDKTLFTKDSPAAMVVSEADPGVKTTKWVE